MTIDIVGCYTGREFRNVEVLTQDDCPPGQSIAWVTDDKTLIRYAIYEDPVSYMLYALSEDTE